MTRYDKTFCFAHFFVVILPVIFAQPSAPLPDKIYYSCSALPSILPAKFKKYPLLQQNQTTTK
jgi:hypothetical protein